MREKPAADDRDELVRRVESLETRLDDQSAQLRVLWGVVLFGAAIGVYVITPPVIAWSLILVLAIVLSLIHARSGSV